LELYERRANEKNIMKLLKFKRKIELMKNKNILSIHGIHITYKKSETLVSKLELSYFHWHFL
jgi:heat shock protein HslJ